MYRKSVSKYINNWWANETCKIHTWPIVICSLTKCRSIFICLVLLCCNRLESKYMAYTLSQKKLTIVVFQFKGHMRLFKRKVTKPSGFSNNISYPHILGFDIRSRHDIFSFRWARDKFIININMGSKCRLISFKLYYLKWCSLTKNYFET